MKIVLHLARVSALNCRAGVCSSVDTRAYPINTIWPHPYAPPVPAGVFHNFRGSDIPKGIVFSGSTLAARMPDYGSSALAEDCLSSALNQGGNLKRPTR